MKCCGEVVIYYEPHRKLLDLDPGSHLEDGGSTPHPPSCSLVSVKRKCYFLEPQQWYPHCVIACWGGGGGLRDGRKHWKNDAKALPWPVSIGYPLGETVRDQAGSLTFRAEAS